MRTEDSYFVHKCLNGETEAFSFLVDKYKESVFALAYAKLRNFADAEDVTQEVFIKAYKNLRNLKRYDSFSIWLHSITNNLCRDWLRSRNYESNLLEKMSYIEDSSTHYENDDPRIEMINKALAILPEAYRQVIALYYLGENNCEEIAKMIGESSPTIRQRLSRARSEIKEEVFAMMSQTFAQRKLSVGFTFRIVEAVKRIKINPISSKPLPWGLSLATGLIIAVLSIGTHITSHEKIEAMTGLPLPNEAKVQRVGEIPVDVFKFSNISVISNQHLGENGLGSILPSPQNAMLMAPQAEGGTWTKKADMPTARGELYASAVNGKIYAIGGNPNNNNQTASVEEYDPVKDEWTKKTDMPAARCNASTCEVNGKIYVFGGWRNGGAIELSTTEEYDPIQDKWAKKPNMPVTRYGHSAEVVNGKIYIISGCPLGIIGNQWFGNGGYLPTVEEYDPVKDEWAEKADMPTGRIWAASGVVNGKIYIIGGWNGSWLSETEEYDPVADTWTKKTSLPTPRCSMASSTVNEKIYVIGGYRGPMSLVEEYDPKTESKGIDFKGKLPTTWGDIKLAQSK